MSDFENYWKHFAFTAADSSTGPEADCELCGGGPCKQRTSEQLAKNLSCEECGAQVDLSKLEDCDYCRGKGSGVKGTESGDTLPWDFTGHCDECNGTGKDINGYNWSGSKRKEELCGHHGYGDCAHCDTIREFLDEQGLTDYDYKGFPDYEDVVRNHVKNHEHPSTGERYEGLIDGEKRR